MIPQYHNAFAPTWLDIQGTGFKIVTVQETMNPANTVSFEVEILSEQNTVDIQKYVQSLLGNNQSITYKIMIESAFISEHTATKSAQQIGEASNINSRLNKILTDRKRLIVYPDYPCEISVLIPYKIINFPISCNDSEITVPTITSTILVDESGNQAIDNSNNILAVQ